MEPRNAYTDIVLGARRRGLQELSPRLRLELATTYVGELDSVFERYEEGEITESEAQQIMMDLQDALSRYVQIGENGVKQSIITMMQEVQRAHRAAFREVAASTGVEASFSGVPTEAFEQMFIRRGMGLTQSYKTLSKYSAQASAEAVEEALQRSVLRGDSYQKATKGIAKGLVQGDEYLEEVVNQYGRRGGLRRWARGQVEPDEEAAQVASKIGYDAERIARTEIQMAFQEADRVAATKSPVVAGLVWNLSPNHPAADICDLLSEQDLHDMGEGVYPAEVYPPVPHPHCFCFTTHQLRPQGQWNDPKPEPQRAAQVTMDDAEQVMPDATENARQRAVDTLNSNTDRAYEVWSS